MYRITSFAIGITLLAGIASAQGVKICIVRPSQGFVDESSKGGKFLAEWLQDDLKKKNQFIASSEDADVVIEITEAHFGDTSEKSTSSLPLFGTVYSVTSTQKDWFATAIIQSGSYKKELNDRIGIVRRDIVRWIKDNSVQILENRGK